MIVIAAFLILRASATETPTTTNFLSYTFLSPTATFTVSVQTQPSSDVTPTGSITFTDQDDNLLTDENNNNPVVLDNGRAIFTMDNLPNEVQNIKAKYQSDGIDDFTVSDAIIPVCRTTSCFKKEDSEQIWTRIYHCDNTNNGYETEISQVKALALTASQILITPDPTSDYGIISKPHTFPIKRMRLGQNLAYPFSDPNSISISNIDTYWDRYGLSTFDFLSGRYCTNTVSAASVLLIDSLYEVCDITLRLSPKSGECKWGYGFSSETASAYINGPVEIPADSPVTISLTSSQTVLNGSTQLSIVFTAIVSFTTNPDSTPNGAIVFQMNGISLTGGILSSNQIIEANKQLKVTYTIEEKLLLGEHTIQAVYVGDYSIQQSDEMSINYAISTAVATTCDLTVDSIIRYGDTITLTSTLTPSEVLGRVRYKFNNNFLPSTSEIQNGIATYTFKNNGGNPIIGSNTVSVSYLGIENHFSACEKSTTVTEKRALTTLTLSLKQEQSSFYLGQTPEIYVNFTSTQPAYYPEFTFTGDRNFYARLQENTRISDFEYRSLYLLEFYTSELHKIKANYAGESSIYNLDSSISNEMSFNVQPAPTTITFTPSLNNAIVGAPVSFIATANCKGTMIIKFDGQQVRRVTVDVGGTGFANVIFNTTGDHEIAVEYSGNPGYCAASTGKKILKVRPACTSYTSLCSTAKRFPCIQSLYDEGKCGNCLINYTSQKEGPAQETDICTAVSAPSNPPTVTVITTQLSLQYDCSDFDENQQYYFAGEFLAVDKGINSDQIQLKDIKCEAQDTTTIVTFTIQPSVKPNGISAATILKKLSEQLSDPNSDVMRSYLFKTATPGQDIVTNAESKVMVRCKGGFAENSASCPSRKTRIVIGNNCRPPIIIGQTCLYAYVEFLDQDLTSIYHNVPTEIFFTDGTAVIRNKNLDTYKFSAGAHRVTVYYEENDWVYGSVSTPVTFTINKVQPTVTLRVPLSPTEYLETITFDAQVDPQQVWGNIGKLQLFDGNTFIANMYDSSYGEFVYFVNNLTLGNIHRITARYPETATEKSAISNVVIQRVITIVPVFETYTSLTQGKLSNYNVIHKFVGGTAKRINSIFSGAFYSVGPSTKSVPSIQIAAKSAVTLTFPDIDGRVVILIYANQWPAGNYLFKTQITVRSKNSLVPTKIVRSGQQYSFQVPTGKFFSGILSVESDTIQWTGPTAARNDLIYTLATPGGSHK